MDEPGSVPVNPNVRTPEDVFRDFRGRRAGIVKALTTDVEKFYKQCDPEKENLCLYGLPNETWQVTLPAEEVPPELPEPALGINFARDGMAEKDWPSLVSVHSDAWLLPVAFYFGARFGFDKEARRQLFMMISGLPTVFEVVTGNGKKQPKTPNGNNINKSGSKDFHTALVNLGFRTDHGVTRHFSSGTIGRLAQFYHSDRPKHAASHMGVNHFNIRCLYVSMESEKGGCYRAEST